MAALSDYLESGILNHIFRGGSFTKPSQIAIALTSGVAKDNDSGSTIPELPSGIAKGETFVSTGYSRINLGDPSTTGNTVWNLVGKDDLTAYAVYSEEVNHSGYFYPLYLNQSTAISEDEASLSTTYTFDGTFPGVVFYSPFTTTISGNPIDPGYTLYDGNGFVKNANQILFNTALEDWGWVSGIAILDTSNYASGNLLMYAELQNPRIIYTGDNIKFDSNSLEINLK